MIDKLMECFTNPVKSRLLLEIHSSGEATAKRLAEIYTDIPQATLYRNLKKMTGDGILKIVIERQVRGTIERTYALASDFNADIQKIMERNPSAAYMQMFTQYMMGFARQFQQHCRNTEIDFQHEMSGFSLAPLYLTDEELKELISKLTEIFTGLLKNTPAPGRKLRNIGLIISPEEAKSHN